MIAGDAGTAGSGAPGAGRRRWSRWVGSVSEALPAAHLTMDAVVALVDEELPPAPAQRACAHVDRCLSCAAEVAAQRQARRRVRGSGSFSAPTSLISLLRSIPEAPGRPPAGTPAEPPAPRRRS